MGNGLDAPKAAFRGGGFRGCSVSMSDDEVSRLRRQEACEPALDTGHLLRATHSRCTTQRFYGNPRVATVRYCERATQPTSALRFTVEVPVG